MAIRQGPSQNRETAQKSPGHNVAQSEESKWHHCPRLPHDTFVHTTLASDSCERLFVHAVVLRQPVSSSLAVVSEIKPLIPARGSAGVNIRNSTCKIEGCVHARYVTVCSVDDDGISRWYPDAIAMRVHVYRDL